MNLELKDAAWERTSAALNLPTCNSDLAHNFAVYVVSLLVYEYVGQYFVFV